jgi:hypothetical protein
MPRQNARDLAARALDAAMCGEWAVAAAIVRRLNADLGGEGTVTAVVGWCDTLIARLGLDADAETEPAFAFAGRPAGPVAGDEVPVRVQWAAHLIMARARLDKQAFNALIKVLPSNPATVGAYVGTVLECVAMTLKERAQAPAGDGPPLPPDPADDGGLWEAS